MILDYYRIFYYVAQYKSFPKQPTLWETISLTLPGV